MSNKKADISQIRKYLNGELNDTAMHQLEREALDDPFLMDALEGYEATAKNQQANLNELAGRLKERTAEKRGRVISWKVWSIAASVLIVLTIGGLWLKNSEPIHYKGREADLVPQTKMDKTQAVAPKDTVIPPSPSAKPAVPLVAQNIKPNAVVKEANKSVDKPSDNAVYQQEISSADKQAVTSSVASPDDLTKKVPPSTSNYGYNVYKQSASPVLREVKAGTNKTDNTQQLSEAVVMNYTSQSKKDSLDNAIALRRSKAVKASILPGKVDGLTVIPADPKSQAEASRITGIILSKGDGSPVIGAAIRIKGTNKSTVTDVNGKFALSAAPASNETLDIASIGFERKQVSAKVGDSLRVELKDATNSLNEVVVVGYDGKKDADGEPIAESAHPQNNWSSFKKYLQANATLPDGSTGNVNVSFTVGTDGSLSDFKIKKSLNSIADQKAIDLIKNGPSWIGNNNHKPETVTVKVKFQK
ncbi:carboxypeptidase-like regulatory domain-containing protein [Mucilaginibacter sp. RCC_168]|uniref:energy transducer TonB n=1 Tax=Mucilaginibacter sp. RCC_168 TaxID=3239221 RepID=UPI00352381F8